MAFPSLSGTKAGQYCRGGLGTRERFEFVPFMKDGGDIFAIIKNNAPFEIQAATKTRMNVISDVVTFKQ